MNILVSIIGLVAFIYFIYLTNILLRGDNE